MISDVTCNKDRWDELKRRGEDGRRKEKKKEE